MSRNWTIDQKKAIEIRNSNVLVSAAAGSGKTAVLVERILTLITEEGSSIDKMLIVTFTKAAAAEMKERIMQGISDKLSNTEISYTMAAKLRKELMAIGTANISTMHSFCNEAINSYFFRLGLHPEARIGDSNDVETLISEALDNVFEKAYGEAISENNDGFFEAIDGLSAGSKIDEGARSCVLDVYSFIMTKPMPKHWLEDKVKIHIETEMNPEDSPWTGVVVAEIKDKLEFVYKTYDELIAEVEQSEYLQKYIPLITAEANMFENAMNDLGLVASVTFDRLPSAKDSDLDEFSLHVKSQVKSTRDMAKKIKGEIVRQLIFVDPKIIRSQSEKTINLVKVISRLVIEFKAEFESLKREKSLIDYSDLEHLMIELLGHEDVRKSLAERYDHIFVDEYQDTNEVQEYIISRISRGNNVFMVGDIKQSIYRFRLADPDIFTQKYHRFKKENNPENSVVDLSMNFRSRREIIESVNGIFQILMSTRLGGIEYDDSARLNFSTKEFQSIDENINFFELNLIDRSITDDDSVESDNSAMELEAMAVASKIKHLVENEGFKYSDIAILSRSVKSAGIVFTEVFKAFGIPIYTEFGDSAFDTLEVKLITNALRVVDNANQDIPLISLMRSPVVGFSVNDILKLSLLRGDSKSSYFDLIQRISSAYREDKSMEGIDPEYRSRYMSLKVEKIMDKLLDFESRIKDWKRKAEYMPIDMLLWDMIETSDYYHYIAAMPGGSQRAANIMLLVERAAQFENGTSIGLTSFIRYIGRLKKNKLDLNVAKIVGEADNVVKMMTIHKSKGLEFPVVMLIGAGTRFNTNESKLPYAIHKDLGLGVDFMNIREKYKTPSISTVAIKMKNGLETKSEELRVLYVALTRPIERFYGFASVRANTSAEKRFEAWTKPITNYTLANAGSLADWLAISLIHNGKGSSINVLSKADIFAQTQVEQGYDGLDRKDDKLPGEVLTLEKILEDHVGRLDEDQLTEIKRRLEFKYSKSTKGKLPQKISVTGLLNTAKKGVSLNSQTIVVPQIIEKPIFLGSPTEMGAADFGNEVHKVLQLIKIQIEMDEDHICEQIDRMLENGLIKGTAEIAVKIKDAVRLFFGSEIGIRMAKSDKVFRERPFLYTKSIDEEEVVVQGIIDCYFVEGDGLVLLDYKTGGMNFSTRRDAVSAYELQLKEYKEALEKLTYKNVKETYLCLVERDWYIKIDE